MNIFQKKDDYNTFIQLIFVACEDAQIKSEILVLLQLPWNARTPLINSFTEKMKEQNAPKDFIEAIELLKKDDVATLLRKLLSEQQ